MSAVVKTERQRAIRELVARSPIGSQDELVLALARRGFAATQATVSRDITELGLVKVARGDRHVYVAPEDLAPSMTGTSAGAMVASAASADDRLRRILADVPVQVRRSGLILLLVGTPGTASVIAQAIDDSSLDDQEGTLAGDDTLLVLFASEARLERWRQRFDRIAGRDSAGAGIASSSLVPSSALSSSDSFASSASSASSAESPASDSPAIPFPTVSEAPR